MININKHITHLLICMAVSSIIAEKQPPLTDPILKIIDGKAGVFDKTKVQKTLWEIKEIKNMHEGKIKLNDKGEPDPHGKLFEIIFKGEKQTIKSLMNHEAQLSSLSAQERDELRTLFLLVKNYFGIVNAMMLVDARGAKQFMMKLIQEYCRKNNRSDSILLKWHENANENEMYEHDVTSFSVLYTFSSDLQNFLAALIVSCPKAYAQAKESLISQKKSV